MSAGSNNFLINIAIVGATGAVGEAMLTVLEERQFPVGELYLLASARSAGEQRLFNNKIYQIQDLADFDFTQVQIALFSAGAEVSKEYAPKAADSGCIVIDNTSQFRLEEDIPLVIPEVNPENIADYTRRGIISNPNCSTIQMLVALKPIYDAVGISRINVATYQAVSGKGRLAITELVNQIGQLLNGKPAEVEVFPKQIAFNVFPHIDVFLDNGYSKEEMKMVWETQKILSDPEITVNPTAVRVPVLYGHSEAINIELKSPLTAEEARKLLHQAPGVILVDDLANNEYPTAFSHAVGHDAVFVGRVREDISHALGLNLWVVADNIRKGAATNAIQIAEILINKYL